MIDREINGQPEEKIVLELERQAAEIEKLKADISVLRGEHPYYVAESLRLAFDEAMENARATANRVAHAMTQIEDYSLTLQRRGGLSGAPHLCCVEITKEEYDELLDRFILKVVE